LTGGIGFSVFRILVGITFLIGGYDKTVRLVASGFEDRWLGEWFVSIIHGDLTSPHVSLLMPEWLLILFGYLVPFWELGVGLCIVLGIYRTAASVFAMALIAIFLAGGEATHAVDYPNMIIEIIQMYVFGFAYFFLYRELERNPQDPLALDNLRFKPGRDRR